MKLVPLARGAAALALAALAACTDDVVTPSGAAPAEAAASQGAADGGRYIVVFRDGVADVPGLARRLTAEHGGTLRYVYQRALRGFAATLPAGAVEALRRNPNVAYVEVDQVGRLAQTTQSNATWGLDRIDQRSLPLNLSYVYGRNGSGVRVYVVDTGLQTNHPEFGGRASVGYDALGGTGADCAGHGTHVAGTAAGGTYGIAKAATIIGVRVGACSDTLYSSPVIAGIEWVMNNHVKPAVANLSVEFPAFTPLDDAVRNLVAAGITAVVASGNADGDACNYSPGRVSEAITVGASNRYDEEPWYSNNGWCVDLYAPGHDITSSDLGSTYQSRSGTSMSAPHVAGVAALVLAQNTSNTPKGVAAAVLLAASTGKLTVLGSNSPNLLLYSQPSSTYRKIGNRWQTAQYIHTEGGPLVAGSIQSGWWTAQWQMEPVAGTEYYRIRNRYTGHYLHAENGPVQAGTIQSGWLSAQWELESVQQHFRIRNRYRGTYLHMEYGSLQLGAINTAWLSAQWRLEDTGIATP
jgi:subtilisin family serine protease